MDYQNNNGINNGFELDWNGEISNEQQYIVLDEGDYDFVVTGFERGQHNGSEKVPPCKKAIVTISINTPAGDVTIKKDFFLHSRFESVLCSFFTCLGHRKPGETFRMDWTKVLGSRGRAHIGPRTYNGNQYNEIKRWLEPAAGQQPKRQSYAPQPQYQQPAYQQTQQPQSQPQYQQQIMGNYTPGKF